LNESRQRRAENALAVQRVHRRKRIIDPLGRTQLHKIGQKAQCCDTINKTCTGFWPGSPTSGSFGVYPGQERIVPAPHFGPRANLIVLHLNLRDHAMAGSELASGGDRAYPIDRPPPT
jgi:hypothetical protein